MPYPGLLLDFGFSESCYCPSEYGFNVTCDTTTCGVSGMTMPWGAAHTHSTYMVMMTTDTSDEKDG